jgi:hypothetical protein
MATAAVVTDEQLQKQAEQLRIDSRSIQAKLDKDEPALNAARAELTAISERIVRGAASESEAIRVRSTIDSLSLRVDSAKRILQENRQQLSNLEVEIGRRNMEAQRALREKQFADVAARAYKAAENIREKLMRVILDDIAPFDALRLELATKFSDLGPAVPQELYKIMRTFSAPAGAGPMHLVELIRNRGYEYWDPPPEGRLVLEVASMRPKAK